jgi:hypothetical protein
MERLVVRLLLALYAMNMLIVPAETADNLKTIKKVGRMCYFLKFYIGINSPLRRAVLALNSV